MLIPKRLFEDGGFGEVYCEDWKMEDGRREDLRVRYECCRALREPGDDHPWCFDHAPADHATRLFTHFGDPGDCRACVLWSRQARMVWADRVLHSVATDELASKGEHCDSGREGESQPERLDDEESEFLDTTRRRQSSHARSAVGRVAGPTRGDRGGDLPCSGRVRGEEPAIHVVSDH